MSIMFSSGEDLPDPAKKDQAAGLVFQNRSGSGGGTVPFGWPDNRRLICSKSSIVLAPWRAQWMTNWRARGGCRRRRAPRRYPAPMLKPAQPAGVTQFAQIRDRREAGQREFFLSAGLF